MNHLQRDEKIIWTTLSLEDRASAGYQGNDDADLINFLSTIENVYIVMIFVEQKHGLVKVSWRAIPGLDVSQIAVKFDGGGHPAASGATVHGTLDDVQQKVIQVTQDYLESQPFGSGFQVSSNE